jgi:hypothetical protein
LSSASQCTIGASSTGAGNAGPYTRQAGSLGYNEVCHTNYFAHSYEITNELLICDFHIAIYEVSKHNESLSFD